ncbi:MAG: terminase small subunit [Planctomycetota bacterium]|jgi:hypothetical protein
MSSQPGKLNDRQQAFVHWYLKLPNATWAAKRAGYSGNERTLGVTGHDLLKNHKIRAEIDRLLETHLPSPKDVIGLISTRATFDVSEYLNEKGQIDVQKLADAGLGHLVKGIKPGREGLEIALVDPQTATKNLARYHRLLGSDVSVDVNTTAVLDRDTLAGLVEQVTAASAETDTQTNQGSEQDDA